jgi:hypothetical protein
MYFLNFDIYMFEMIFLMVDTKHVWLNTKTEGKDAQGFFKMGEEGVENLRFSQGKLLKSKMLNHFVDVQLCPKTRASLNSKLRLKFSKNSKIQNNNHIFDAKFELKPKRLNCWL